MEICTLSWVNIKLYPYFNLDLYWKVAPAIYTSINLNHFRICTRLHSSCAFCTAVAEAQREQLDKLRGERRERQAQLTSEERALQQLTDTARTTRYIPIFIANNLFVITGRWSVAMHIFLILKNHTKSLLWLVNFDAFSLHQMIDWHWRTWTYHRDWNFEEVLVW